MELQFQSIHYCDYGEYIGQQPYTYRDFGGGNSDDERGTYARFDQRPPEPEGSWRGDAYCSGWYGELQPCAGIAHDTMEDRGLYTLSLYRNGLVAEFKSRYAGLIDPSNFEKLWSWAVNNQPQRDVTLKIEL